jgi:hypothetical protein
MVTALGTLFIYLIGEFVAGHACQQLEQLLRLLQLVLAQRYPYKETAQDGPANIERIKETPQAWIAQAQAHGPADGRFIPAHQFGGGGLISCSNPANKIAERRGLSHGGAPGFSVGKLTALYPRPTAAVHSISFPASDLRSERGPWCAAPDTPCRKKTSDFLSGRPRQLDEFFREGQGTPG